MSEKLVIIPTYNEMENIATMVKTVMDLPGQFDLLVVDDGSPDGTASIVKSLQKDYPRRIHLIERSGKLGLGTAYIAGFKYGLENGYEYIFEMDADFSHNPNDLIRLYEACKDGADVAVGSRYVEGGGTVNWPWDRYILSMGASVYVRMITWMPIKDPTAGFKCYKAEVLRSIDLDKIKFIGYAFQIEMKYAARSLGFKVVEVPITFTDRIIGHSKMTKGIISEAVFGVLRMRMSSFFKSYAKK